MIQLLKVSKNIPFLWKFIVPSLSKEYMQRSNYQLFGKSNSGLQLFTFEGCDWFRKFMSPESFLIESCFFFGFCFFALLSFFVWFFIFITLFQQFCHCCSIFYKIRKPILYKLHGFFSLATLSFLLLHNKCSIYGSMVAKKKWFIEQLWKLILTFSPVLWFAFCLI